MKAIRFDDDSLGAKFEIIDIPAEKLEEANMWREKLMEAVSEVDESIMEKYLDGKEISESELRAALRKGTLELKITPVVCGSAFKNKGVQQLLDAIVSYLPSPMDVTAVEGIDVKDPEKKIIRKSDPNEPFSALAFKIATDPFVGHLTFLRIYSGKIEA